MSEYADGNDAGGCEPRCSAAEHCVDGVCMPECTAGVELCNGENDDCDDRTDEPFDDLLGEPCTVGLGRCAAEGRYVCRDDGYGVRCSEEPGHPAQEQCNGADDDCDGYPDYFLDEDGSPVSVCRCRSSRVLERLSDSLCAPADSCQAPVCPDGGAARSMTVSLQCAGSQTYWAQCEYEAHDVGSFDRNEGSVLEVGFCVRGLAPGERMAHFVLRYGAYPRRKQAQLFTETELEGLADGCFIRYLTAADFDCEPDSAGLGCEYAGAIRDVHLTVSDCRGTALAVTLEDIRIELLTGSACTCDETGTCPDPLRPQCDHAYPVHHPSCPANERCVDVCVAQ